MAKNSLDNDRHFWQNLYGTELSVQDLQEIRSNLIDYHSLLKRWKRRKR